MNWNLYVNEHARALEKLNKNALNNFVNGLKQLKLEERTLWMAGNGGAASTASHMVADFNKTTKQFSGKSLKSFALADMISLSTAFANDISFIESLANSLSVFAKEGDGLLTLSVSGTSPNIIKVIEQAKKIQMKTFAIFGSSGQESLNAIDFPIVVDSNDYQIVENVQLIILHWITKVL